MSIYILYDCVESADEYSNANILKVSKNLCECQECMRHNFEEVKSEYSDYDFDDTYIGDMGALLHVNGCPEVYYRHAWTITEEVVV